jgi:hypothetical protein
MKIVRNSIWKKRDMDGTFWPLISQWLLFFLKHLKQQIVSLMMTKTWSVGWFGLVNPQLKTLSDDQYNIHKNKRWKYLASIWRTSSWSWWSVWKELRDRRRPCYIVWDYHAPRVHFAASMICTSQHRWFVMAWNT